jgi:hypothetical protein
MIVNTSRREWSSPDLFHTVARAQIPFLVVDGRVAMAAGQPDLVAEPEPAGGG